jgi:hypothetical protein
VPAIPRKVDRVAALLVSQCGLPPLDTGRRSTQGVSQQVSENVFINRHGNAVSWHRVAPGRSSLLPVLVIRLRPVADGVEIVVQQGDGQRESLCTVRRGRGLADDVRKTIDALWTGTILEHAGDVDPDSPVTRLQKWFLADYRLRRARPKGVWR